MEIQEAILGKATIAMTIGSDHLNAAGLCHGAAVFALADVAFALASNSHGTKALALEAAINYLRPTKQGERLTATAEEVYLGEKTGLYSIKVTDSRGKNVAFLKATAFRIQGESVAG